MNEETKLPERPAEKPTKPHACARDVQEEGRQRVLAGLMGALAVALPQAFHLAGLPALGSALLPMHLPVLLAGFLVRPGLAATVGILAPPISFLITGMPPAPLVPMMVAELAVLGAAASLFRRRLRLPVWAALPAAIAARVAVTFGLVSLAGPWLGIPDGRTAAAWVAAGLPGIDLQLMAVPPALRTLARREAERNGGAL